MLCLQDYVRDQDSSLRSLGMKEFATLVFENCPELNQDPVSPPLLQPPAELLAQPVAAAAGQAKPLVAQASPDLVRPFSSTQRPLQP